MVVLSIVINAKVDRSTGVTFRFIHAADFMEKAPLLQVIH
jgi:hypothetical protein